MELKWNFQRGPQLRVSSVADTRHAHCADTGRAEMVGQLFSEWIFYVIYSTTTNSRLPGDRFVFAYLFAFDLQSHVYVRFVRCETASNRTRGGELFFVFDVYFLRAGEWRESALLLPRGNAIKNSRSSHLRCVFVLFDVSPDGCVMRLYSRAGLDSECPFSFPHSPSWRFALCAFTFVEGLRSDISR